MSLLGVLLVLSLLLVSSSQKEVVIGVILPFSNHYWSQYAAAIPPLYDFALRQIASRTDILPGYKIRLVYADTKGSRGAAMKALFDLLSKERLHFLIGPFDATEAEAIAFSVVEWNLPHVIFSVRNIPVQKATNSFSIYITDDVTTFQRISFLKHFGWSRIATLAANTVGFVRSTTKLQEEMKRANMTLLTSAVFNDDSAESIRRLLQFDAKIIVASIYDVPLANTFCEAYKQGLCGSDYVWLVSGNTMDNNWIDMTVNNTKCTPQQLQMASRGFFTIDSKAYSDRNKTTISGMRPYEFKDLPNVAIFPPSRLSAFIPFAYDTIWAVALALNATLSSLGPNKTLEDFTYADAEMAGKIQTAMMQLHFDGITGPIYFAQDGNRWGDVYLNQHYGSTVVEVGAFPCCSSMLTLYDNQPIRWEVIASVIAGCGILMVWVFLFLNIKHRKHKFVKMSSPNFNNIILVGAMVMFFSVIVDGVVSSQLAMDVALSGMNNVALCMARAWIQTLGFTISFGALFSKTWRVYVLFRALSGKKKAVYDSQLYRLLGILVGVVAALLTVWTAVDPSRLTVRSVYTRQQRVMVNSLQVHCESQHIYWIIILYVSEGLLLVFGLFLSWETRRVSIPGLNDSRFVSFSIYNTVMGCVFVIPISHLLNEDNLLVKFVLNSLVVCFCTSLVVLLLFIPKIYHVWKGVDPPISTRFPTRKDGRVHAEIEITRHVEARSTVAESLAVIRYDLHQLGWDLQRENQQWRVTRVSPAAARPTAPGSSSLGVPTVDLSATESTTMALQPATNQLSSVC